MASKGLIVVNPYDNNQMKSVASYEANNNLDKAITEPLEDIKKTYTEKEYEDQIRKANEFEQFLFLEDSSNYVAGCMIYCYKDVKSCFLTLLPAKTDSKKREMIKKTIFYAINGLDMEEVFINISSNDNKTALTILELGFEDLGGDNGNNIYMTDRSNYTIKEGVLHGNNQKH